MKYKVPGWVASRVFYPNTAKDTGRMDSRAVISNELNHEFITLEGLSAVVWDSLWCATFDAPSGDLTAHEIQQRYPEIPLTDIEYFINELRSANLIVPLDGTKDAPTSSADSAPPPNSGRYSGGSYIEPAAGGDNLTEEFEFQDWALAQGWLWSVGWEMSYRCNERCIHCFNPGASHGPNERAQRTTAELNHDEACALLLEMRSLGVFRLLLTGGEVLLRKDFFEILAEARRLGFSVTIFTNGTLLDANGIDQLVALYPHRVELSLYSTSKKHDTITGLKGSFAKTVNVARALTARGVTVAIKTSVMRDTAFDHRTLRELCADIGCEYYVDFNLSAGGDGARSALTQLSLEAGDLVLNALDPATALWVGASDKPNRFDPQALADKPVCGAGRSTLSVSPEGHITPCLALPIHLGSVREEGLAAIWRGGRFARQIDGLDAGDSALARWQGVARGGFHACGQSERCAWCQKCPGLAFLECANEFAPSVTNCRLAAARRIAFDLMNEYGADAAVRRIDIERLEQRYPEEAALWTPGKALEQGISLNDLKGVLRDRTRATVLRRQEKSVPGTHPGISSLKGNESC